MSYTCLTYHLITGTKDRRPCIRPDLLPRLVQYMGGIIHHLDGRLIEANGPDDHMHIVATLSAKIAIADAMRDIKARSTAWVRQTFPGMSDFGWQDGYSAFTVSKSQQTIVVNYVRGQQEHHRKVTFEEELIKLLELHQVEFDPKYLSG